MDDLDDQASAAILAEQEASTRDILMKYRYLKAAEIVRLTPTAQHLIRHWHEHSGHGRDAEASDQGTAGDPSQMKVRE
jgi:hypothetical protein